MKKETIKNEKKDIINEDVNVDGDVVKNGLVKEEKVDVASKKSDVTVISVITKDGQLVREYSKEVHGKDFVELAKEFADKKGYSLK